MYTFDKAEIKRIIAAVRWVEQQKANKPRFNKPTPQQSQGYLAKLDETLSRGTTSAPEQATATIWALNSSGDLASTGTTIEVYEFGFLATDVELSSGTLIGVQKKSGVWVLDLADCDEINDA